MKNQQQNIQTTKNKINPDWISVNIKVPEIRVSDEMIKSRKGELTLEEVNAYLNTQYTELSSALIIDYVIAEYMQLNAFSLLQEFCKYMKDKELKIDYFVYKEKGVVPGFSHSYALNGSNALVFSYNRKRIDMGVNLQITGAGCKLVMFNRLRDYFYNLNKKGVKFRCNRLDIAFDDFEKVIPVNQMVEATERTLQTYHDKKGKLMFSSRIKREHTKITTNHFNGQTTKGLTFGKHSSVRSFRLYDKRAEQKIREIDYWYRLEIELHSNAKSTVAQDCFMEYLKDGNIALRFYEEIQKAVLFFENGGTFNSKTYESCKSSGLNSSYTKTAIYWIAFLEYLNNYQLRIIISAANEIYDVYIEKSKPTLKNAFIRRKNACFKQYGKFFSFLLQEFRKQKTDFVDFIQLLFSHKVSKDDTYLAFTKYFEDMNLNVIELCMM